MKARIMKTVRDMSAPTIGAVGALAVLVSGGCESQSAFEAYVYDQELLLEIGALNQSVQFVLDNPDFVGRGDPNIRFPTQELAVSASSRAFSTLRELTGVKASRGYRLRDFYDRIDTEIADLQENRKILNERIAQAVKQASASLNHPAETIGGSDATVTVTDHGR
jgi:hypothetical protein